MWLWDWDRQEPGAPGTSLKEDTVVGGSGTFLESFYPKTYGERTFQSFTGALPLPATVVLGIEPKPLGMCVMSVLSLHHPPSSGISATHWFFTRLIRIPKLMEES